MVAPVLSWAVLQPMPFPRGMEVNPVFGLGSGAAGAFLTTLLVGAILVALAPDYVTARMAQVRADPVDSFLYGFVWLLLLVVLTVLLVVTLVGVVVAIPLALVTSLVWAVGAAIGFLAIADRLVDGDDWLVPLLVAAALNGGLALTGIGGLLSFGVGAAGFGAVLRDRFG